jgi:hypothetical protein
MGAANRTGKVLKLIMAFMLTTALFNPTPATSATKSCPKLEPILAQYFPAKVVPVMSKIAYRESRCNPRSLSAIRKNGRPDVGLLQIQGSWVTVTRAVCKKQDVIKALLNIKCNLKVARYLYDNGGLSHWRATSGK